ncbi:MAG: hypothetical protein F9K48_07870 [Candidatus Brocadia sp.]|nr:MAG: hypothetical protein F9K48_07870 [Candidatus Brocadia sp.]
MKTYPPRTFVHRILLIRLGIAATLIAVCAGFTTYLIQERQLTQQVIDLGRKGFATLASRVNRVGWASPTKYHALAHIIYFWWAMPTLLLYDKYAGHEGDELRQELVSFIEEYFSAGLEILRYY